jgi:hypothetical protein
LLHLPAALRVVKNVVDGAGGSSARVRMIAELVSDERVVALFDGPANIHDRGAMHVLLWTWFAFSYCPIILYTFFFEKGKLY